MESLAYAKEMLDAIENNPDMFLGLEDKKITPAINLFLACSLGRLAKSMDKLTNTLESIKNVAQNKSKGYFQSEGAERKDNGKV